MSIQRLFACIALMLTSANTASAYCLGSQDSCPSASSSLDVVTICGTPISGSGQWLLCNGTYSSIDQSNEIAFGRIYARSIAHGWGYYPVACVGTWASGQLYPLRHSAPHGGGVMDDSSQQADIAMCLGAGADTFFMSNFTRGCGAANLSPWNHGSGSHRFEVWAQTGDDEVEVSRGTNLLCGGTGADKLTGGNASDDVDGGSGDDRINGYDGTGDQTWGYYGSDVALDRNGSGNDMIYGEFDADSCLQFDENRGNSLMLNGGTGNCYGASCVCGSAADDSCNDRGKPILPQIGEMFGVEVQMQCDGS